MTSHIVRSMSRARGFTLVEALVALVVLSIGLLGVASLQLSSLRWNHGASMRSQATLLAYDIVDRMRANQIAATTGLEYDVAIGANRTGSTVAAMDIQAWKTNLARTLPAGDGSVRSTPTVTPSGTITTFLVTVTWDDTRGAKEGNKDATDTTMSFALSTQL